MFQKSDENTTCQLYAEISRLVRLYAANLLPTESITGVGDNLSNLTFETQLERENLGIGMDTWASIAVLEQERDPKPFFEAVRNFYVSSIKKMIQKFPFGDPLLRDLGILQPNKVTSYSVDTVVRLAKRFPQLQLFEPPSLETLRDEFLDLKLSPMDLPTPTEYMAADKTLKQRAGTYWWEVGQMVTAEGKPRFPCLYKLMVGLLTIPASNADSERGFSILRKIHTDQRSNLNQSTIIALMSVKFNCSECCYNSELSEVLLKESKKATSNAVKK